MTIIAWVILITALTLSQGPKAVETANQTDALVRGNNAFALELYGKLAQGDGNRFLSPFSISTALAMTYAGAEGETASQMAKALHFDLPADRLHSAFHRLATELLSRTSAPSGSKVEPDVQLLTANAIWTQSGEPVLTDFRKRIEVNYRGGIYPVDFRGAAEAACRTINAWVEEQTRDKIKDLIKPNLISAKTSLVLTNAIYFKALWDAPFHTEATRPGEFLAATGEKIPVEMMNQSERFGYYHEGTFQALELPYKGNALAMVVFLPGSPGGLAAFESSMTAAKLDTWLAKLSPHRVNVGLPKFHLKGEFELKAALSALGMSDAFRSTADFSGMTGTRDLMISAVVHKAFVEVEEKGTEAAAATGVIMGRAMAVVQPIVFRADRPFFFLIRDLRTGSILFLGRMVRPESS
jgi:serpin B